MKIKVKGQIKDLTNNEKNNFETHAIKTKNKVSYQLDDEKYTLLLTLPNKLILNRETPMINSTLYFEKEKTKSAIYHIKEQDINLEINIKTNHIELSDTSILVNYTVIDSDITYEYKIEMSE